MVRLFWFFIFLVPFQSRLYKFLKPLSCGWIKPVWQLPAYFETCADLFISDFLLIGLFIGCLYQGKFKLQSLWEKEQKYLSIFLLIAMLSIVLSDYASYALHYWRWGHLVISAGVVYGLRGWVEPSIQKVFKTLATVVVLSATLECSIALPQYFLQRQLGLKMLGEKALVSKHNQAPNFQMPKKAVTSLDYYWNDSQEPCLILRGSGTFSHPNVLGGFLVFSILMSCVLYEISRRRPLVAVALILQVVTLFITYSRSALFACMGALLLWVLTHFFYEKKIPYVWKPLVLGLTLSMLLFFPQIFSRGGVVSSNQLAQASDSMRISMQNVASLVIRDHPWFGVGFNNYLLAFAEYAKSSEVQPIHVHNIYLLIAVETGLIGLGFFLLFCLFVLYRGWQLRPSLEGRALLLVFLAFLAIGLVDYYPIVLQQIRLIFFLVPAFLCCWASRETVREPIRILDGNSP